MKWRLIRYSYHFNCLLSAADLSRLIHYSYHINCLIGADSLYLSLWLSSQCCRPIKWRLIHYSYHFNCLIGAADLSSGGWSTIVITLIVLLVLPTYQVEVDSLYLSLWLSFQCCRPMKWRLIRYSYHFNCLISAADLSSGGWFTIVIILIVLLVLPTYQVEVDLLYLSLWLSSQCCRPIKWRFDSL